MNLKLALFLPDLFLFSVSMYLLMINLYKSLNTSDNSAVTMEPFLSKIGYYAIWVFGLGFLSLAWIYCSESHKLNLENFIHDRMVISSKFFIFLLGMPWLGLGNKGIRRFFPRENMRSFEYPCLLLFSMVGSFLIVSSSHLCTLFIGFELQMLPILVAASLYEDKTSSEVWSVRYLILEGLSISFFMFGSALIYGAVGDLNIKTIGMFCHSLFRDGGLDDLRVPIGFFMILIVFLFRLAAFPFHIWIKGFYRSSSNLMAPFMTTLSFALFIALIRLLFLGFYDFLENWKFLLFYVGIASCMWGAISALFQTNVRSFFSCNYMFHLGVVLLGISSGSLEGVEASLLYWTIYTLSTGAFFFFWSNLSVNDQMLDTVEQAQGLGIKYPAFTLLIALTLLSLSSLPPFAGFWCKLYILKSLIVNGWFYVGMMLIFTIIASFQYFHIIRAIYFTDREMEIRTAYDWKTIWTFVPIMLTVFFFFQDKIFDCLKEIMRGTFGG